MTKPSEVIRITQVLCLWTVIMSGCGQSNPLNESETTAAVGQSLKVALKADKTYNVWSQADRYDLSYCISNASPTFQSNWNAIVNAMDSATRSWSDRIGVRFRYVPSENGRCTNTNTAVLFNVGFNPTVATDLYAKSFFPYDTRDKRQLGITAAGLGNPAYKYDLDLDGIIRHELGHILGFVHEGIGYHINNTVWICNSSLEGSEGTDFKSLTPTDTNSVMFYPWCRTPAVGGFRQTEADYAAAATIYGMATSLVNAAVL
jgi:serralysin